MASPGLIKKIRFRLNEPVVSVVNNRFVLSYFNRAVLLAGKGKNISPYIRNGPTISLDLDRAIVDFGKILRPKDIENARSVFSEAAREYRRNNTYWDMLMSAIPDYNLLPDIFFSKKILASGDPELSREIRKPTEVQQNVDLIFSHLDYFMQNKEKLQRLFDGLNDLGANNHFDIKSAFYKKYGNLPPRQIELKYLAAIHAAFVDPNGGINYGIVSYPPDVMKGMANIKIGHLDSALSLANSAISEIERSVQSGEVSKAIAEARLNAVKKRQEMILKRRSDLETEVKSGKFYRE